MSGWVGDKYLLGSRRRGARSRGDEHDPTHGANHHLVVANRLHTGIKGVDEDVTGT